jgi:hypothetical protein
VSIITLLSFSSLRLFIYYFYLHLSPRLRLCDVLTSIVRLGSSEGRTWPYGETGPGLAAVPYSLQNSEVSMRVALSVKLHWMVDISCQQGQDACPRHSVQIRSKVEPPSNVTDTRCSFSRDKTAGT